MIAGTGMGQCALRALRREVVEGYLSAPENMEAEVLDGELQLLPRPRRQRERVRRSLHG